MGSQTGTRMGSQAGARVGSQSGTRMGSQTGMPPSQGVRQHLSVRMTQDMRGQTASPSNRT